MFKNSKQNLQVIPKQSNENKNINVKNNNHKILTYEEIRKIIENKTDKEITINNDNNNNDKNFKNKFNIV